MSDLAKEIEEGRSARRQRAILTAAKQLAEAPEPAPRRQRAKRFSRSAVERIVREIEVGVEDVRRDMPEVGECDAVHDIAWSLIQSHGDEHPDTLRVLCGRYDLSYRQIFHA